MKTLLYSIIPGFVGSMLVVTFALLFIRFKFKKMLDDVLTHSGGLDLLKMDFDIMRKKLGVLDDEIDKLKKHNKD